MNIKTIAVKVGGDPFFTSNCYLVSASPASAFVVVIDPGDEPELILAHIGDRTVLAIILTHGHYDHIGAVARVAQATGAKIYAHEGDAVWIDERYDIIKSYSKLGEGAPQSGAPHVDSYLHDGEELVLGEVQFTVLHTPGHSQGSVCLYQAEEGVLFSGDTLFKFTCGRTDLPGGSPMSMHESLARLATLPPQTVVYAGHEDTTTIGAELKRGLSEY